MLAGESCLQNITFKDVAPMAIGTDVADANGEEVMKVIIPANSPLPIEVTKKFKTGEDNSTFFSIKVLQGDERLVEDNHLIAETELHGIEPAPAGQQKVEVTYKVNEEGLLTVSAKSFSDPN